jgi:hypothetical protein
METNVDRADSKRHTERVEVPKNEFEKGHSALQNHKKPADYPTTAIDPKTPYRCG